MEDRITSIQEIKDKISKFVKERKWTEARNPKNFQLV